MKSSKRRRALGWKKWWVLVAIENESFRADHEGGERRRMRGLCLRLSLAWGFGSRDGGTGKKEGGRERAGTEPGSGLAWSQATTPLAPFTPNASTHTHTHRALNTCQKKTLRCVLKLYEPELVCRFFGGDHTHASAFALQSPCDWMGFFLYALCS